MRLISGWAGMFFLGWFAFSPVIAIFLYANFESFFVSQGLNPLWVISLTYLFLGVIGCIVLKIIGKKILGGKDSKTNSDQIGLMLLIVWIIFSGIIKLLGF